MSSPFQKKFCGKTPDPIKMLGDLNKDGKMSSYEQTRQDAIEANSPTNYGSPLEQKKQSEMAGYQAPDENQIFENLPTRQENKAELDAARFSQSRSKTLRKEMIKMPSGQAKSNLAQEVYNLHRQLGDAETKMRKQKKQDYGDILKAGATIAKNRGY
tara:strand:+ start:311 stop:781 length:471 start_codon:yes stop_codon:yes gene_type:complete